MIAVCKHALMNNIGRILLKITLRSLIYHSEVRLPLGVRPVWCAVSSDFF